MNSAQKKHSSLTSEEVSETKQTLMKLSHRLRMQIPSELIDVNKDRLASGEGDKDGFETLSSLRLANSERIVDLLREVEKAITRINDETYGICANCGHEIDKETLQGNVTETWCARCRDNEKPQSLE